MVDPFGQRLGGLATARLRRDYKSGQRRCQDGDSPQDLHHSGTSCGGINPYTLTAGLGPARTGQPSPQDQDRLGLIGLVGSQADFQELLAMQDS
jgi:hypothetical protein